jgi:hypothetical protein
LTAHNTLSFSLQVECLRQGHEQHVQLAFTGTDAMIFKTFSPKNVMKKLTFLTHNKAEL